MQSYEQFIESRYKADPDLKAKHSSLKNYLAWYSAHNGLHEWLESLRGNALNIQLTISMGKTYAKYANRQYREIPRILLAVAKFYELVLPPTEDLLTEAYWEHKVEIPQ